LKAWPLLRIRCSVETSIRSAFRQGHSILMNGGKPMSSSTTQRFLVIYSTVVTATFAVLVFTAANQSNARKTQFDSIDVQRINVVEPDGTRRMVISNMARAPGLIFKGKEYPHPSGRKMAGMIFFNDEGTQNGGLIWDGKMENDGKVSSHGHLSFDDYEQDQVVVIEGNQDSEGKSSLIQIMDQPDYSLEDELMLMEKNRVLPKEQQQAALEQFRKTHSPGQTRVFLGRRTDRSATLNLRDTHGRDGIVLKVAADGSPSVQLLNESGEVIEQLPVGSKKN